MGIVCAISHSADRKAHRNRMTGWVLRHHSAGVSSSNCGNHGHRCLALLLLIVRGRLVLFPYRYHVVVIRTYFSVGPRLDAHTASLATPDIEDVSCRTGPESSAQWSKRTRSGYDHRNSEVF